MFSVLLHFAIAALGNLEPFLFSDKVEIVVCMCHIYIKFLDYLIPYNRMLFLDSIQCPVEIILRQILEALEKEHILIMH